MVNRERDDNIYYARLAEQGERYEDMIKYMKEVAMVSTVIIIVSILMIHTEVLSKLERNNSLATVFTLSHFRF